MIKIISAVVLIFLTGGAWLYLDCLNKQQQEVTAQAQQGLLQARAEAARRAETRTTFTNNTLANLTNCQATAEKAKNDYATLLLKVAPSKRGQAIIPQAVTVEAETIFTSAKAACQQIHDAQMQKSQ
jgi:hypothetical protein